MTQYIFIIIIGVAAILLARETRITSTDIGRLLLVVSITLLVVSIPTSIPFVDRFIAAIIGGYALHRILNAAMGPVPFTVLRRLPVALLVASHSAYRMQFGVRKVAYGIS